MTAFPENWLTDPLMTPSEVGRWLQVTPRTVTEWARRGLLKSHRTIGGHRRFRRSDVVDAMTKAALK